MTRKKCLQLLLLTAVFRLAGNLSENAPSREVTVKEVTVKETEAAILSCNISALMKGQTSDDRLSIRWVTNDGTVCDFYKGKSYAANGYSERAAISRPNDMEHEYLLTINKTRFSDSGDYFCKLQKPESHAEDVTTVRLTIKGHEKNVSVVFGGTLSILLPVADVVKLQFRPASGGAQVQVCIVQDRTLRAGCVYESRATLRDNELQLDNVSFADEGSYSVTDFRTGSIMNTVVLAVEGQMKNYKLEEGKNLSIPLCSLNPSHIEFWGDAGNSSGSRVFQVKNGQVTHPAGGEYLGRLTVSNGALLLSSLTAKDRGKYVVRAERDGQAVLTIDLKIKTRSLSPPSTEPWFIFVMAVTAVACVLALSVSCRVYKWYRRRQMERRQREAVEAIDAGNGKIWQKTPPMNEGRPQQAVPLLYVQGHG